MTNLDHFKSSLPKQERYLKEDDIEERMREEFVFEKGYEIKDRMREEFEFKGG